MTGRVCNVTGLIPGSSSSPSANWMKPWGRTILRTSGRNLWKILETDFPDNVWKQGRGSCPEEAYCLKVNVCKGAGDIHYHHETYNFQVRNIKITSSGMKSGSHEMHIIFKIGGALHPPSIYINYFIWIYVTRWFLLLFICILSVLTKLLIVYLNLVSKPPWRRSK